MPKLGFAVLLLMMAQEPEVISRTEYTLRIENFFQFQPLRAGKASQFRIELKDVSDDSHIEGAQITLTVRRGRLPQAIAQATSRADKAPGIYLTSLTIPTAGSYSIEFRIKNAKFDERMLVDFFEVGSWEFGGQTPNSSEVLT